MNAPVLNAARLGAGTPASAAAPMNARTLMLLTGPIAPTLLRLAWPNVLVMLAQASTGLIETWWVSHLGTDALTGMALVFPGFMMMAMLSAGAVGGGISSAIARSLGAAMQYSNVVFAGNILVWLMNGLASVVRGTGNMLFPSMVVCIGVTLLIPLSPLFIFGFGPMPALGIAGGGVAVVATTALMGAILAWHILAGNGLVRLRMARLKGAIFADIWRVGGVGALSTLQTTLTVALTTGLVGAAAGPDAVAGYGTGSRLEYLLIPLVFGLGAPLVALVGTNIGAGQNERALRIAMTGATIAFLACEAVGVGAAVWPSAWLKLFGDDPVMIATGSAYLRFVGPAYGFFGLGLALYFASQGAGRLMWPLTGGFARLIIAVGGGWLALALTGSLTAVFVMLGVALAAYGTILGIAVRSGVWFGKGAASRRQSSSV